MKVEPIPVSRRGYVVLNPEEAAKLWVPDIIIDKVIVAKTIIVLTLNISSLVMDENFTICSGDPDPCSVLHCGGCLSQALQGRHHQVGLNAITMTEKND